MPSVVEEVFDLKSPWTKKGFRYKKATYNHLSGTVFSRDSYLLKQEEGGTIKAKDDEKLAIRGNAFKDKTLPKSMRAHKILDRDDTYTSYHNDYIFQRKKGKEPTICYILRNKTDYEPRLGMYKTSLNIVDYRFENFLSQSINCCFHKEGFTLV